MLALFGSWAYGMFDADAAARRFTASHGLETAQVGPVGARCAGTNEARLFDWGFTVAQAER